MRIHEMGRTHHWVASWSRVGQTYMGRLLGLCNWIMQPYKHSISFT
ncbi:hypothetical protein HanXRQr2_Chr05g0207291 [Helianthus annuus]|uniref:Uncharacterized protein n=1 Tax=Helianthus annuus TaxID=4232 RepID=A0A9K3IYS0_HELAN|nr:hypothetical protein HanXRQr2_Chr05g0207291 [Helianthus annuus]